MRSDEKLIIPVSIAILLDTWRDASVKELQTLDTHHILPLAMLVCVSITVVVISCGCILLGGTNDGASAKVDIPVFPE
jgi:hypothetical protein